MITVDQYSYIRTANRVYGKKIREIARDTGHSRNTVKKALRGEYEGYSDRKTQPYPVLGPYLSIIDRWLEGDKDKPKKQRHTAKRVYDRLCHEHGFEGGARTVRRRVGDAKMRFGLTIGEVFIPLIRVGPGDDPDQDPSENEEAGKSHHQEGKGRLHPFSGEIREFGLKGRPDRTRPDERRLGEVPQDLPVEQYEKRLRKIYGPDAGHLLVFIFLVV